MTWQTQPRDSSGKFQRREPEPVTRKIGTWPSPGAPPRSWWRRNSWWVYALICLVGAFLIGLWMPVS